MNSLATAISEKFENIVFSDSHSQDVFYVNSGDYKNIVQYLKNELDVVMCIDVTAVDYHGAPDRIKPKGVELQRFEVVSNFISHIRNERIRLIVQVDEHNPHVDSIADIFPGANFAEREAYDMFGIVFDGHPDLTRILMPDEWETFPLRKDDANARIPVNFSDDFSGGLTLQSSQNGQSEGGE